MYEEPSIKLAIKKLEKAREKINQGWKELIEIETELIVREENIKKVKIEE